jgi:HSP20 family protein
MSQDPYEIAQREIERLWRDLVYHRHPGTHFAEQPWVPPVDVVVTETLARVIVELAGVPRDGVRVRLRGRTLEISGRRTALRGPIGAHYHRAEIYFGDFRREIEMPWEAESTGIDARFRDGMLEIHIRAATAATTDVPVRESAV